MKVEYLPEGSKDCPLIRLYSFTTAEIRRLHNAFSSLASGSLKGVCLADFIATEAVDGCSITFVRAGRDRGIVQTGKHSFSVELSAAGWNQTAGLTAPFCNGCLAGHQWLTPFGEIQLLLSPTGTW